MKANVFLSMNTNMNIAIKNKEVFGEDDTLLWFSMGGAKSIVVIVESQTNKIDAWNTV